MPYRTLHSLAGLCFQGGSPMLPRHCAIHLSARMLNAESPATTAPPISKAVPTLISKSDKTVASVSTTKEKEIPTNYHRYVNEEGREVLNLSFVSEALGLPAENGYGWADFEFGRTVGTNERYTILRKLGWGMHSSTWLSHDKVLDRYVALKVLTGHATEAYNRALSWEADALRLLSLAPHSEHCIHLLDEFTIPPCGPVDGSHLTFVMPLYRGDVKALVNTRKHPFPPPLAKRIILHLLRGIAYAHERGIVHTDIKHDNIFVNIPMSNSDVQKWIQEDPPRRHRLEMSHEEAIVRAAVSQPMKPPSDEEALHATFVLADFGSAQPSNRHPDRPITPPALRAPEVFLGAKWDKPADIWSFGCLACELVAMDPLFVYKTYEKFDLSETENILYQMLMHTGEEFQPEQLNISPLASEYFNTDCQLKKGPMLINWPLEIFFGEFSAFSEDEVPAMATFIRRCLRLDPNHRSTAAELLNDECLKGVA